MKKNSYYKSHKNIQLAMHTIDDNCDIKNDILILC